MLTYCLLGAGVGLLSGLLGLGGGLLLVPSLIILFPMQGISTAVSVHLAVGTSLASIVFTSLATIAAHHWRGAVRWELMVLLAPGVVIGAWAGAGIAGWMPGSLLSCAFGVYAVVVALRLIFARQIDPSRGLPGAPSLLGVGMAIGTISAIIGIGGGSLTVPFLVWCNVPMREAVATAAATGLPIALAGTTGFALTGWGLPLIPSGSIGYVYLPALAGIVAVSVLTAPLGAHLAHVLPTRVLKQVFGVVLLTVGGVLLGRGA